MGLILGQLIEAQLEQTDSAPAKLASIIFRTSAADIQYHDGVAVRTVANLDKAQTLTNKTLTSPVINTPTGITKSDVGLANVDNTSDATKNSAVATLTNKTLTSPVINSPTGLVKADVGLGNVDNTSDADKNAAVATLTNKTLTSPVINSPTGLVKADVGLGNVDNTSDATKNAAIKVLTNTDFDGGVASDARRITLPKAAKATLDALTRKAGTVVFDTDSLKAFIDNGSSLVAVGAGASGSKNYITDGDAEGSLIGTGYADGAAVPLATVLGTPTATFVQSTSSPLTGTKSFIYTPGALGNGRAFSFVLDSEDKYTMFTGKLSVEIGGTGYVDGDIQFWVVTPSGAVVQPTGYKLLNSLINQTHQFQFQTEGAGTYIVKMHQATATSTYTLKVDSITVGPQSIARGPMISDWKSYTPTFSAGFGAVATQNFEYRQVGDSIEIRGTFTTGTTAGSVARVSLPSGLSAVKPNGATVSLRVGQATTTASTGVATNNSAIVFMDSAQSSQLSFGNYVPVAGSTYNLVETNGNALWTSGVVVSLSTDPIKIQGWSSSQVLSSDLPNRKIYSRYSTAVAQPMTTGVDTIIDFGTKEEDLAASVTTGAAWKFTAPQADWYTVTAMSYLTNGGGFGMGEVAQMSLYKNGSTVKCLATAISQVAHTTNLNCEGSMEIYLKAGEYVDVRLMQNSGAAVNLLGAATLNWITVSNGGGGQQIASSESVACRYTTLAGQSIPDSVDTTVLFGTKQFDTHSAYNTSNGRYYPPVAGKYRVGASAMIGVANYNPGSAYILRIYKNNTAGTYLGYSEDKGTQNEYPYVQGSTTIELLAGDYIEIKFFQNTAAARTLYAGGEYVWMNIERLP